MVVVEPMKGVVAAAAVSLLLPLLTCEVAGSGKKKKKKKKRLEGKGTQPPSPDLVHATDPNVRSFPPPLFLNIR